MQGRETIALYDPHVRIESARLYGNVEHYAYYYLDLLVGRPKPQLTSVIVDTGSNIVAFPCANCAHCGHHIDPPFNMIASRSARWVNCSNQCNNGCPAGRCSYEERYREGSSIKGLWFQDFVQLGDAAQHNPPVISQLGCHLDENNLFYTQRANGIMGMAPFRGGRPSVLTDLLQDRVDVKSDVFSICLAPVGGLFIAGGYNVSYHVGEIQWIPMKLGRYYLLPLDMLRLGETTLGIGRSSFGVTMVDSGTTFTYFPHAIYKRVVQELSRYCEKSTVCELTSGASPCYALHANGTPSRFASFPDLRLTFGNVSIKWRPQAYLYRRDKDDVWCPSFAANGDVVSTVLGSTWMQMKEVVFDLEHRRLGVVDAKCPEYRRSTTVSATDVPIVSSDEVRKMAIRNVQFFVALAFVSALVVSTGAMVCRALSRSGVLSRCIPGCVTAGQLPHHAKRRIDFYPSEAHRVTYAPVRSCSKLKADDAGIQTKVLAQPHDNTEYCMSSNKT